MEKSTYTIRISASNDKELDGKIIQCSKLDLLSQDNWIVLLGIETKKSIG